MRASAPLVLLTLASCNAAPSEHQAIDSSQRGEERRITGVLTLYTEGQSFHECPLKEPWNCFKAKGPDCRFNATSEALAAINAEITKAGATQGFATLAIVMLGIRVDGVNLGHLAEYRCEFRGRSVLQVDKVPDTPPDTFHPINVK
jgi:hypothetical protein